MSSEPPETEGPRRLELVISGEHGYESDPPPASERSVRPTPGEPIDARRESPPEEARRVLLGRIPFGRREERLIRSLAGWLGLTAIATLGVCAIFSAQWATGRGTVPSAALAVITGAIGLWSLLAGWHFGRVARPGQDDADQLVSALGNLRSILILKAIGLFLILGLSCFAFSIVASLLALL